MTLATGSDIDRGWHDAALCIGCVVVTIDKGWLVLELVAPSDSCLSSGGLSSAGGCGVTGVVGMDGNTESGVVGVDKTDAVPSESSS